MAENNSFKNGAGSSAPPKLPSEIGKRVDEYEGKYNDGSKGRSEEENFGTNQLPVSHGTLPAKNLRSGGA